MAKNINRERLYGIILVMAMLAVAFGYTFFTANGFLNTIDRHSREGNDK